MAKKAFAAIALAVFAFFAVPAAANAEGPGADGKVSVSGEAAPGNTLTVSLGKGTFQPGESVTFASTGSGSATQSVIKADTVSSTKTATKAGAASVDVKLPTDATGSYTVTGTGSTSGSAGTATIRVPGPDLASTVIAGGPASTGLDAPVLFIWGASGALVFAVALVIVMNIVRRQRTAA